MGALPKKSANKHYYKIFQGTIVQEWSTKPTNLPQGVELKERVSEKTNKTRYYIELGGLVGTLLSAKIESTDKFGDFLMLELGDKDGIYILSIPTESKFFRDAVMKFPNINPLKDVMLKSYAFEDKEGKKVAGIKITQDDEPVLRYFTKDTPNGMPEMVKKRKGKEDIWDSTDQTNFLYDQVTVFNERLNPFAVAAVANTKEDLEPELEEMETDGNIEDLPF